MAAREVGLLPSVTKVRESVKKDRSCRNPVGDRARILAKAASVAALCLLLLSGMAHGETRSVTIDGSQTFQTISGFGANVHYFAWTNNDLKPVLDALTGQGGLTLFRVIFDNTDWEATNAFTGTNQINWNYFNALYATDRFQHLWGLIGYLNQKGITNGIMLNFQGPGPKWMGRPLTPGLENAWAQMITSLLAYARNVQHLQFNLVGPDNEPNTATEGIEPSGAAQYVTMLHALANQLDSNGLGDFRIVAPDLSYGTTDWMPQLANDPVVISKLAHFGLHSYCPAGEDSVGVTNWLYQTVYANRGFWMTEYNTWCASCESGYGNPNDWTDAREMVQYLLPHLANGASAGLIWEGYDSYEATLGPGWSYWGLFGVDNINAIPKTYTARRQFYTLAQIANYVRPGAQQIAVSGPVGQLVLQAYYNPGCGQLSLVGVNTNSGSQPLSCALASLPAFTNVTLSYTSSVTNLAVAATVPVTNGGFAVTVPGDCVFAITGQRVPPASPLLQCSFKTNGFTLTWPGTATNFTLFTTTNPATNAVWYVVTNSPNVVGGQYQVFLPITTNPQYFRLRWP